jgi:hypothetical protein
MPCRQVSTFNGVAASSGSYRTEAECNQACQEGACCDGAVCTVKPQCQCQGAGQTFKGVGTVCADGICLCCKADGTPKQTADCSTVSRCWCLCGEGSAPYPRFVNVSISFKYDVYREISRPPLRVAIKEKSASATVTMTLAGAPSRDSCPVWLAGRSFFGDVIPEPVSLGGDAEGALVLTAEQVDGTQDLRWRLSGLMRDYSERPPWSTAYIAPDGQSLIDAGYGLGGTGSLGGPYTSGACFSNMSPYSASTQGVLRDFSFTINGVQA